MEPLIGKCSRSCRSYWIWGMGIPNMVIAMCTKWERKFIGLKIKNIIPHDTRNFVLNIFFSVHKIFQVLSKWNLFWNPLYYSAFFSNYTYYIIIIFMLIWYFTMCKILMELFAGQEETWTQKWLDTEGEEGRMNWESSVDTYTLPCRNR